MDFDINTFRGLITLVMMIAFIGMVFWAYSGKRKSDFSEAAQLPLEGRNDDGSKQGERP